MMDPTGWKLLEQRRELRKTGALKSAKEKKHRMMKKHRIVDFKAKLSKGISLISTITGGIQKINDDQENTYTNSSSSGELCGDIVFCCSNKILYTDDTQVVKKALGAAMLTSRYAEIISKRKADKANLQKERERQQYLKRKEDKAAEPLEKKQAADLRVKQREAARVALELVERTVELEDNLMILKELENLSQCSHTYIHRGGNNGPAVMVLRGLASGSKVFNPLEQLGLYMKEEEFVMDDDEETFCCQDVEEGEIV